MVVLEAIGLAAGEVFDYNRENYSFDNDQRILKEKMRLKMQCERFGLFREDIKDLVELTVSKMDMYHAVAALLLGSAATLYTEGRMHVPGNSPPWYIDIYFISIAGCFCYLILAVWLSMYASVASHSYGVRLRTRFVRLPIPSLAQLSAITAKFQQFERQGVSNVLRVPFGPKGSNTWQLGNGEAGGPRAMAAAASSSSSFAGSSFAPPEQKTAMGDWLGAGEAAFGRPDILERAADGVGLHVKLFRRLQAKWQCYDAYSRVSMAIGINQLLQTVTYYVLGCTLIENRTISTAIALVVIYQSAALSLCYLDIAGVSKKIIFGIQVIGSLPTVLVLVALALAKREESGLLEPNVKSFLTPAAFFIEVIWYEALLWVARPSHDEASLPRRFRSVLFLDVFGDGSYDPTDAEQVLPPKQGVRRAERHTIEQTQAATAERHIEAATAALRRWEACPGHLMQPPQSKSLKKYRQDFEIWRRAMAGFMVQAKGKRGVHHHDHAWLEDYGNRAWADLSSMEQEHEPFAGALLGPFDDKGRQVFYDLEAENLVYEDVQGRDMLTLRMVHELVRKTELVVQTVLSKTEGGEDSDSDASDDPDEATPKSQSSRKTPRRTRSGLPTKVERLPWKTLRRMTRCFQLCWVFLGIMNILYLNGISFDSAVSSEDGIVEGLKEDDHYAEPDEVADDHAEDVAREAEEEIIHTAEEIEGGQTEAEHAAEHAGEAIAEAAEHGGEAAAEAAEPAEGHGRRLREQPQRPKELRRRASSATAVGPPRRLPVTEVEVAWPFGEFFRPKALSWWGNTSSGGSGRLLVGSPFATYKAVGPVGDAAAAAPLQLRTLPRASFPPGAQVLCGVGEAAPRGSVEVGGLAPPAPPCVAAALVPEGVAVWGLEGEVGGRADDAVVLPVRDGGLAWELLAGAVVPCGVARRWLTRPTDEAWCLVLAGVADGRVPIAAAPLPAIAAGSVAAAAPRPLRPRVDAPILGAGDACRAAWASSGEECRSIGSGVVALHLESRSLRLWALLQHGEVQAWDLLAARHLGRWTPQWPKEAGNVTAAALCERPREDAAAEGGRGGAGDGELLLAALSDRLGPRLWRARLPVISRGGKKSLAAARPRTYSQEATVVKAAGDAPKSIFAPLFAT